MGQAFGNAGTQENWRDGVERNHGACLGFAYEHAQRKVERRSRGGEHDRRAAFGVAVDEHCRWRHFKANGPRVLGVIDPGKDREPGCLNGIDDARERRREAKRTCDLGDGVVGWCGHRGSPPRWVVRKRRMAAPISAAWVSSAKCPVSSNITSACGTSRW